MSVFLQPLQTIVVSGSSTSSITFSSIPQTYTDLVVKVSAQSSYNGGTLDYVYIAPNSAGSSCSATRIYGNGANAYSSRTTGYCLMGVPTVGGTANVFSNNEIYFSNYTSSNYKSFVYDTTSEYNGSIEYNELCAGLYSSTSAITSLNLSFGGTYFSSGSKFSLYGILRQGI